MVTTTPASANFEAVRNQVRELCHFPPEAQFTLKWLDEEHDPCVISTDFELGEALRLTILNKECQLTVLVFNGVPPGPGKPCPGEDLNMYRRGAKRWKKKFYLLLGHKFAARRFNRNAQCVYCHDRIWGFGQQGFKCITCRILLHRRCQYCVRHRCGDPFIPPDPPTSVNLERIRTYQPDQIPRQDPGLTVPIQRPDSRNSAATTNISGTTSTGIVPVRPTEILVTTDPSWEFNSNATAVSSHVPGGHTNPAFIDSRKPRSVEIPVPPSDKTIPIEEERITELPDIPTVSGRSTLQDFVLLKVIGRGSYAKVFQVEHKPTNRIYAMKVIKKETILNEEDIEWVQTEKHVFECATNHPFLVGLHSCFQTKSRLFFVIEFVNGGDLMFYMQRNLRLAEDYVRFYSAEICIALNFLHERGIIYRDLKLDNVLMDNEGHIKLTDYGMCKEGITGDIQTSTFCGTPNYIAPEILRGESYSFSVDWWALGVLMFEMLAGRSPWEGVGQSANPDQNTEDYLFQVILTRPIRFPRSISVRGSNILRAFLTKNPTDRLGCPPESNFGDVMSHAFFHQVDWVALEQKQIPPPYRPAYVDDRDLTHFDPTFTDEPVVFTPDDEEAIARIDQTEFEGFEYVNPLLMSVEEPV